MHAESSFECRYFEGRLSKNLERVKLIWSLHPFPIYGQDYENQKGPGTSY